MSVTTDPGVSLPLGSFPLPGAVDLGRTALFLDVDGTLLDIAPSPEAVMIGVGLPELLDRLGEACGGALALVTGREIAVIDRFFTPFTYAVAGIHGAEMRLPDGSRRDLPAHPEMERIVSELGAFVDEWEGLLLEQKGRAVAVHYRARPEMGAEVADVVTRVVGSTGEGLEIQPGKMVVEVRPSRADKGRAIEIFMEDSPFAGRSPLFIGDDWTDESAFRAVNALNGRSIRVGQDERPTEAKERLSSPTSVREWLARLAEPALKD
ncbi:trehalose-phosphatase [Terrihabitans sp. B22-R8]|uniref:trehalose-phosphatase n=1 Tax=Terrihabitans sp. B22-R8 TaxID=3425128 RepID=UPI00403CB9AB